MKFKDKLKKQQPFVYTTLYHALSDQKIAHAYLFSGPNREMKKETAYFFAKSIMCDHGDPFACENCATCMRIDKNEYTDVIYIDGSDSIKKDQIIKIQEEFSKTALERKGKQAYIINGIENASIASLNSLLKFLEEPTGDVVAILIVDQMERLLPTIISRCQNIAFKSIDFVSCFNEVKLNIESLDAYLLSRLFMDPYYIHQMEENESYQHARYLFMETLNRMQNSIDSAQLFLQIEAFPKSLKNQAKEYMQYYYSLLLIFFKDCILKECLCEDEWYKSRLAFYKSKNIDYAKVLSIIMKAKDIMLRSVNSALLIEEIMYDLKEVIR